MRRGFRRPGRLPSGRPFSPRAIGGLVAWYRGDLGISIGTGVSAWANQVPGDTNTNLVQATGANQPTYNASDAGYGNQSTLTFDGVNDSLASLAWAVALAQPFTWFAVGNDSGGGGGEYYCEGDISGVNRSIIGGGVITAPYSSYSGTEVPGGSRSNAKRAIGGIQNGASHSLFISAKTAVATGNAGANGVTALVAGASFAGTALLAGKLAEIVVYSGALSQPQVNSLLTYFGARYGITIGA